MNPKKNKATLHHRHRLGAGILFVGKKVWISELSSLIFICILLATLFSISFMILNNELRSRNLNRQITLLKIEKINLAHSIENLKEKNRLSSLLCMIVGNKVPVSTIHHLADLVHVNSRQYGYDPELLLAVISVESRFDTKAQGKYRSGNLSGALGLMQLKYETALEMANILGMKDIKKEDLFNPEVNLILGTAYLTRLIRQFKSFKLGLLAYNLGPGTVRSTLSRKQELPMRYYEKVLSKYYLLQELTNRETTLNSRGLDCR